MVLCAVVVESSIHLSDL
ncbi:hypothetical protein A2U01_0105629, partial [Trifolium medium]|nr:hypothetical protein [Trifolium medium]